MYEQLMEQAVERENRVEALRAVVRNGGSAGIDRMTVKQLKEHVAEHWESIREKLLAGSYTPSPVKRVDIPKPGGGTRMLGIPTVMDRFVQQLLLGVLQPIFEPRFSEHSYGFRPGRGAHDAIKAAQQYVQEGKEWVVDIDISKFFDHVNHDIWMAKIGAVIRDKRVLRLIGRYLRAGIMSEGVVVAREEGTPQGGPLSPMLANVYLDALDKELEGRGLGFCRYADDCNIYVGSQQAAQRVMEKIVGWIEEKLRLKVNPDKSAVGKVWERKFLGFRINPEGQIEVATQSLQRVKDKVRKLWRSCQSLTSVELREQWCAFVRGWWGYFRQAEATRPVFRLEPWIRRHMRKCFWQRWHNTKGRRKRLQQLGIRGQALKIASSGRGAWRVAKSPTLHSALSNKTLRRYGFLLPSELAGRQPLGSSFAAKKDLTFGYITPGPDTWYKRDVDGFVLGARLLGIKTVVLNSDYDVQKELSNIESLITQGVDGMAIFSFNQQGATIAAKKCKEAGIPLVTVDNCGQALSTGNDIVAAIDFDWKAMGKNYAEYMAQKYPGKKVALITGLLEHLPVQMITGAMKERMKELGKNEIVAVRDGKYNPPVAVNQAQDLVQSGVKFDILWIMNEDMAAAVIRYLKNQGLLDQYTVIAQNGSPAGIPLVQSGELNYTISSSPGWEGMVALLALHQYSSGDSKDVNQQIMLPVIPVTKETILDKAQVVPWEYDPVWISLTKQYFPKLGAYLPDKAPQL